MNISSVRPAIILSPPIPGAEITLIREIVGEIETYDGKKYVRVLGTVVFIDKELRLCRISHAYYQLNVNVSLVEMVDLQIDSAFFFTGHLCKASVRLNCFIIN